METLRLASLWSRALAGAKAIPVAVEVHLGNGLPQFQIVGLPEAEVRESRERVRVALQASAFEFPQRRITVNLAPADLPKESGRFDLPIAVGILVASGVLGPACAQALEFAGELGLDGRLHPVRGALAMAWAAHQEGRTLLVPSTSAREARLFEHLSVLGAENLREVCDHLAGKSLLPAGSAAPPAPPEPCRDSRLTGSTGVTGCEGPTRPQASALALAGRCDLAEVRGQLAARRALEVAAAGGHSLLLHGPPGCGKTLLAERLAGLLPPFEPEEALAFAINRSLAGAPVDAESLRQRPCRRPHHTTPTLALTGGGAPVRPGEMSLAHGGVLLLDELPEFARAAIEALREPLESGEIHVSRVRANAVFPARFQLVCTMNPCPCGRPPGATPPCRCSATLVQAYRARISLPLLDRIDLWVPMHAESESALSSAAGEGSAAVRARVLMARALQKARQGCENALLRGAASLEQARLGAPGRALWHRIAAFHQLSPRGAHRLLRVARTLADLGGREAVSCDDLHEAATWRIAF